MAARVKILLVTRISGNKKFSKEIGIPIAKLINLSFKKGIFPNSLKLASVIPVFKKDNYLECNNYRPLSLGSNISKIMEKVIHQLVYIFLDANKMLKKVTLDLETRAE